MSVLQPHEPLAKLTNEARLQGFAPHPLGSSPPHQGQFASATPPSGFSGFHLGFHDADEIGPKMLARIAK
jgi:hypothetical protein